MYKYPGYLRHLRHYIFVQINLNVSKTDNECAEFEQFEFITFTKQRLLTKYTYVHRNV